MEGNAGRQVGLDDARDNIDRRTLRCHNQVNPRRPSLLRQTLDQKFNFFTCCHHQVRQLINDDHNLRHGFVSEAFFLILRLASHRVITDLDLAAQWRTLCLCPTDLFIEICKITDAKRGHHTVPLLHLLNCPFQGADGLCRLGHHWRQQMGNVIIAAQFKHLGVDHDHPALVRRQTIEQRQDHTVQAN